MRAFSGIFQGTKRNAFGSQCAFGMLPSNGPPPYPLDIGGLLWRLESTLITGVADGDPLLTWLDEGPDMNNVNHGTLARRPIYNTVDPDWGGKPSLTFDGVDDSMSFGSPLQPVSLFIGVKSDNVAATLGRYISSVSGSSGINDDVSIVSQIRFNDPATDINYSPVLLTPALWEGHYNNAGDSFVARNGVEVNEGARSPFENATYTIGDYISGGGQCFGGSMVACIAYSGFLSPTDRSRVRQYLNDVYFGGVLP